MEHITNIIKNMNIKLLDNDTQFDNLTKLQSNILINRVNENHLERVEPSLNIMEDLYKLKDIDKAATLLAKHITEKNRIALVFDYDCD